MVKKPILMSWSEGRPPVLSSRSWSWCHQLLHTVKNWPGLRAGKSRWRRASFWMYFCHTRWNCRFFIFEPLCICSRSWIPLEQQQTHSRLNFITFLQLERQPHLAVAASRGREHTRSFHDNVAGPLTNQKDVGMSMMCWPPPQARSEPLFRVRRLLEPLDGAVLHGHSEVVAEFPRVKFDLLHGGVDLNLLLSPSLHSFSF